MEIKKPKTYFQVNETLEFINPFQRDTINFFQIVSAHATREEAEKEKQTRLQTDNYEARYPQFISRSDLQIEEIIYDPINKKDAEDFYKMLNDTRAIKKILSLGTCNLNHEHTRRERLPMPYNEWKNELNTLLTQFYNMKGSVN